MVTERNAYLSLAIMPHLLAAPPADLDVQGGQGTRRYIPILTKPALDPARITLGC